MNMTPVAQAVQRQGRGEDTMLVHMTPGEVGGLQALAMQHGGSLSINPNTGLPEAGFLKNILPTVLGIALTPFMGPLAAGLTVGGVETVRTGDIGKGFLAGLGAFGGAQIGGALGAAGTTAGAAGTTAGAAGTAAGTTAGTAGAGTAGLEFARTPAEIAAATGGTAPATSAALAVPPTPTPIPTTFGDTGAAIYGGAPSQAMEAANLAVDPMAVPGTSSQVITQPTQMAAGARPTYGDMGQGFKDLFTKEGAFDQFIGTPATEADAKKGVEAAKATGLGGGYGAAKTVGMAAAPALFAPPPAYEPPKEEESDYEGPYKPTERNVRYPTDDELRRRTSEFTYFNPSNPIPFAEGGETAPDVAVSPNEARVYQNIINTQRLAGLPALDPARFAVMPGRSYEEFVYDPVGGGQAPALGTGETDYGISAQNIKDPNVALSQGIQFFRPIQQKTGNPITSIFNVLKKKSSPSDYETFTPKGRLNMADYYYDPELGGFVERGRPNTIGGKGFSRGGSVPQLEDGGFVLTKKAVDGLGRGSNKKGQENARRGLGAIPIKGPGTGTSDSIKTTIDGKRPALISNGEAYVPKRQVAKKGGAKAFYALMKKAEKAADKRKRA